MAENKEVKSNRDTMLERMRNKYPDENFDDDEALYGKINADYDDYDSKLKGYENDNKVLSDMFAADPRSAQFLSSWQQGKDPAIQLVELFGDDFVDELKKPEKQEELAQASKAFAERVAKEKEYEQQYNDNIEQTRKTVEQMQKDEGLSDDDIDRAMEFLVNVMQDGIVGKFSRMRLTTTTTWSRPTAKERCADATPRLRRSCASPEPETAQPTLQARTPAAQDCGKRPSLAR